MTCDDCLSLTLHKKLSNLPKNVSLPRIDKKKLHTQGFQLKGIGRNMRCKLLQKRSTGKIDAFSNISLALQYIKLFIPKILFILVLCNFNFYFKIKGPSPNNITLPTKIKNFNCPPSCRGVHAMETLWTGVRSGLLI